MPNNRLALPGVGAPRKSLIRHCCVFPVWKNEHPNSVFSVPWQPGVFSVCTLGRSTSFTLDLSVKHSVPYPFPPVHHYGLFPPMDSESDSDSKPYHYIALCRSSSTAWTQTHTQIRIPFPNGYCTHFREGKLIEFHLNKKLIISIILQISKPSFLLK